MNLEQLGIQLGIAGFVLLIGYRIALVLIKNWRETEAERTQAIAAGFSTLTGKVDAHHTQDLQSHQQLATGIARFDAKLDAVLDGQERSGVGPPPQPPRRAQTPAQGVPVGYYGPRRPTQGEG